MSFQSAVNLTQGFGIQGEILYSGPYRSKPWQLISTPALNVIGARACTVVSGQPANGQSSGIASAGGSGAFAGIIANPKVYANFAAGLGTTLTLPDDTIAELVTMGEMLVFLTTAANPGDPVVYNITSGALSSVASSYAVTASFATNVMTVTATAGVIGLGTDVSGFTGVAPGTIVTSLGTGTGGNGTYNLSTSPGSIGSAAGVAKPGTFAGTGNLFVPGAKVILRATSANALAIIGLDN